jgi:hypothetical protein
LPIRCADTIIIITIIIITTTTGGKPFRTQVSALSHDSSGAEDRRLNCSLFQTSLFLLHLIHLPIGGH